MEPRDFTIRILVKGGNSGGFRVVEKSNWNGCALVFSRASYPSYRTRAEFEHSGIYLLADSWTRSELPKIYVGEGENVKKRLDSHSRGSDKEYWNEAIIFTSKNNELNTAQVEYLEARLIELAKEFKRCKLANRNRPRAQSLSEMDRVEVEGFLEEILTLLPTLGVLAFNKPESREPKALLYHCKGRGYSASGWESASGLFVVKKGSHARLKTTKTFPETVLELREELKNIGVLVDDGKVLRFDQNFEFSSPSYAATIVRGMRTNGRTAWKNSNGKTLKEVQEEKIG